MSLLVSIWVAVATTLLNGFFAGVETGFTSARRISLDHRARQGSRAAAWAARLARRREDVITSAVVGNNVAVVVGTSVLTAAFVAWLGAVGEPIAAVAMTVVTIVFGEILPKTIYRAQPERMVVWSTPPFAILAILLAPVTWMARSVAGLALRLTGGPAVGTRSDVSRDALVATFQRSHRNAQLDDREQQLVLRFARNSTLPLRKVVTPMEAVATLTHEATVAEAVERVREGGHSRLPVRGPHGDLRGLVLFRDLIDAGPDEPVAPYERTLVYLPAEMGLDEAIGILTGQRGNMAAVLGHDDRAIGIVTLEDLLEPLVGDILDEHDRPEGEQRGLFGS